MNLKKIKKKINKITMLLQNYILFVHLQPALHILLSHNFLLRHNTSIYTQQITSIQQHRTLQTYNTFLERSIRQTTLHHITVSEREKDLTESSPCLTCSIIQ